MLKRQNPSIGLLLGLCAGDRNGGPQRMAMRIAEALLEKQQHQQSQTAAAAASTADNSKIPLQSILTRYMSWLKPDESSSTATTMTEPDRAYDTGAVWYSVLDMTLQAAGGKGGSAATVEMAQAAARQYYEINQSAGANPCHRNSVIAMAQQLLPTLQEVAEAAKAETRLTHVHPEASDTAAAVAVICRRLIEGADLMTAVNSALPFVSNELVIATLKQFPYEKNNTRLDQGGRSPLVLKAALYFLQDPTVDFEDALNASIQFAGPANFCPVLVGSIGGAMHGVSDEVLTVLERADIGDVFDKAVEQAALSEQTGDEADVDGEKKRVIGGVTLSSLAHRHFKGKPGTSTGASHIARVMAVARGLAK